MANSKLTNFKDLKVEYPERYKVINEDLTEETKTIRFLPGITYQEGTPETAENFNNIQRNSIYEVAGNRIIEGQNEIYDITIEGSQEFIFTDLKLCLVPNETNTKKGPLLRFNGNTYTIKNAQDTVNIGSIASKEKIFLNLNFTQKTAEIIGVLTGGSHRTIKQLDTDYRANTGIPYDPEIEYIQDTGTKKVGYCYKDRNQEGIFKCKESSTTTTNLSNIFDKFDNNELLNRLQNLSKNKIFATKTSKRNYSAGIEIILTDSHNFKITIPKTCVYLIMINRYRGENTPGNNIQLYVNNILIESMPLGNGKVSTITISLLLNTEDIITTKNLDGIGVEYAYSILEA